MAISKYFPSITFILLLLIKHSYNQYIDEEVCLNKCVCLSKESAVSCHNRDNIRAIPTNIPFSYTRLILQHGNFDSPHLSKRNMTNLQHLTFLKIIKYNLKYIAPHTFSDMKNLLFLDLSHNNLYKIPPFAFQGLSLNELHLMENPDIEFSIQSFNGLTAQTFNLRSNRIKTIQYELFEYTQVKYLFLYNNSITTLEHRFKKLFEPYNSFIDLTDNPLICNCSLSWLKYQLAEKITNKKGINITCSKPIQLNKKGLVNLTLNDLQCRPLQISEIKLSLNYNKLKQRNYLEISCISIVGGYQIPKINWLQDDSSYLSEFTQVKNQQVSLITKSFNNVNTKIISRLNITSDNFDGTKLRLICVTSTNKDITKKLEVQIVNLKQFLLQKSISYNDISTKNNDLFESTSSTMTTKSDGNTNNKDRLEFLFQKHFSLLELLGAIIGTFVLTFVGILMIVKIVQWNTKKSINYQTSINDFNKVSNTIKPYMFTPPYDYSSTYSVPQDPYILHMGFSVQDESIYPVQQSHVNTPLNPNPC